jgi:pyruvate,water dikinase
MKKKYILWFKEINIKDVPIVGGKNASLGEMYRNLSKKGVNIPNGFAVSAQAYFYFLKKGKIKKTIQEILSQFNPKSIKSLQETGKKIRKLILDTPLPQDLEKNIIKNYKKLCKIYKQDDLDVAVRSSATAEDLPSASFAGQHETYLNVRGEKGLLKAVKNSYASLFTDRAIMYREEKGFKHMDVGLSTGVQKMVRSDLASSGIMFTLDTETGFPNVVLINSIFGIGEMIVKGLITPDEFYVFKPTLRQGYKAIIRKDLGRKTKKYIYNKKNGLKEVKISEKDQLKFSLSHDEILTLAKWGIIIEEHYSKIQKKWMPQDIEWAKDGKTGELFIVQSRPETVHSIRTNIYQEYKIKTTKKPILNGIAIGNKIGTGKVHIIKNASKLSQFKKGEVLVTKMTDPDWTSVFPMASAIITNEGSKTCHAAIISRELGVPCIVGTMDATKILKNGQEVTVDCTQGLDGKIFHGKVPFKIKEYNFKKFPKIKTKIMINIGAPEIAFATSFLPNSGVGLAREEFIIAEKIRIHPLALYHYKNLKSKELIKKIDEMTIEHKDKREYFIKELAEGIAQIAAAFYPKEVIVRFSDFKTNEYRNLIGGEFFEREDEANPMLGFRGACRYIDPQFKPAFLMECEAIKRVKKIFGLNNVSIMVPFCRTIKEAKEVRALIKKSGLLNNKSSKLYVMCEIPSNVILINEFLDIFDGMSIGSNDLTQLTLGIDRDNAVVQKIGDERNEAVKKIVSEVIKVCKKRKKYVGICGQGPSDFPKFAEFLMKEEIESMSLSPDTVIKTILNLGKKK